MSTAQLSKLPADEKLGIINGGPLVSPAWEEEALQKTEADFAAGRIENLDCDVAQKKLRKRFE